MKITLEDIKAITETYASAYDEVAVFAREYQAKIDEIHNECRPLLAEHCKALVEIQGLLEASIKSAPELFTKPRTFVFDGFRVGLQKQKGTIDYESDAAVVAAIKKHFSDQIELLIATKETPIKKALNKLQVSDLRKLGVTVEADSDRPVIVPVKGDVSKLIDSLLSVELSKDDDSEAS